MVAVAGSAGCPMTTVMRDEDPNPTCFHLMKSHRIPCSVAGQANRLTLLTDTPYRNLSIINIVSSTTQGFKAGLLKHHSAYSIIRTAFPAANGGVLSLIFGQPACWPPASAQLQASPVFERTGIVLEEAIPCIISSSSFRSYCGQSRNDCVLSQDQ